ncbi:MAG: asparagine synthase (glutamine-hydrolyzing) [Anaerolineaceae bacterium]|nr:asparagine synthase (glutamine-hydrolyzing) [Anaerolineaceae bacterium]
MCGISGIVGTGWQKAQLDAMVAALHHRGPDNSGTWVDPSGTAGLGHDRLSIIDLSNTGYQPMRNGRGDLWIIFNGELYNYLELRAELADYPYISHTDTEVALAAYERWGDACLERFIGMFAFAVWDTRRQRLFAARDRFGVKPFYYATRPDGGLVFASEIKALHAAGVPAVPDTTAWATYLANGLYDHTPRTFWSGVQALPPGSWLAWESGQMHVERWYDLADRVTEQDCRSLAVVEEEYLALMKASVRLRFRSDVPVAINLSGGLDSSVLLGLVGAVQGADNDVKAYTFITGDPAYDETPWVREMLARTRHPSVLCQLRLEEVPALAESVQQFQDEPYSGLPTLAYASLFERARADGVIVLLDGNGMDEQWAGYDYYENVLRGQAAGVVQGTRESPIRAECLVPEFRALAEAFCSPQPFADPILNLQLRDAAYTKIPRAMRFNDRISMRVSTELREPFLDHRMVELALRQPVERKIQGGKRKWLLRRIASRLAPNGVVEEPKRPMQTPQREWLRGPLVGWADSCIQRALECTGGVWLDPEAVRQSWKAFCAGQSDNSFYVWQWITIGLMADRLTIR